MSFYVVLFATQIALFMVLIKLSDWNFLQTFFFNSSFKTFNVTMLLDYDTMFNSFFLP